MRKQQGQFNPRELVLCLILVFTCGAQILALKLLVTVAGLYQWIGALAAICITTALEILDQPLALTTVTVLLLWLLLLIAYKSYQASRRLTVGPNEVAVVRRYRQHYGVLPQGHYLLPFGAWVERRMSLQAWYETRRIRVLS